MFSSQDVLKAHRVRFGEPDRLVFSPGRINLIGEHTDYSDGFVLPAAVELGVSVAITARRDGEIHLQSLNTGEEHVASQPPFEKVARSWVNYPLGVHDRILETRLDLPNPGFNATFGGDLPIGKGMASSAAVSTAFAFALNELFALGHSRQELAFTAQVAEHSWAGVRCGIMDPYACLFGRDGRALLLDCRNITHSECPVPEEAALLMADSGVRHDLSGTAYNIRREESERAAEILARDDPAIRSLRDATPDLVEASATRLGPVLLDRARYVVAENRRVHQFAAALQETKLDEAGALLGETQQGLRDLYKVSSIEVDTLVRAAESLDGVYGARMMGGGFGGLALILANPDAVGEIEQRLSAEYSSQLGRDTSLLRLSPANGTRLLDPSSQDT